MFSTTTPPPPDTLTPLLFTVYFDILIKRLESFGIGCHIGKRYCGVIGIADDFALVCLTLYGLQQMIALCEEFASKFNLIFSNNRKKFKLMCFIVSLETKLVIKLCNQLVDVGDSEVYLGTIIFLMCMKSQLTNKCVIFKEGPIILS